MSKSPARDSDDDGQEAGRVELLIVAAGARRDLGQLDSAVVMLQVPELEARPPREWSGRLRYAYADALLASGRTDEGRSWLGRTLEVDPDNETGAGDLLLELDGIVLDDEFDLDPIADEPEPADDADDWDPVVPVVEQPALHDPIAEEPVPAADVDDLDLVVEGPEAVDPVLQDRTNDEPDDGDDLDPVVEDPEAVDPVVEQPALQDPTDEDSDSEAGEPRT